MVSQEAVALVEKDVSRPGDDGGNKRKADVPLPSSWLAEVSKKARPATDSSACELPWWLRCPRPPATGPLALLTPHEFALVQALTPHCVNPQGQAAPLCLQYYSWTGCPNGDVCPRAHDLTITLESLPAPVQVAVALLGGSRSEARLWEEGRDDGSSCRDKVLEDFRGAGNRSEVIKAVGQAYTVIARYVKDTENMPPEFMALFRTYLWPVNKDAENASSCDSLSQGGTGVTSTMVADQARTGILASLSSNDLGGESLDMVWAPTTSELPRSCSSLSDLSAAQAQEEPEGGRHDGEQEEKGGDAHEDQKIGDEVPEAKDGDGLSPLGGTSSDGTTRIDNDVPGGTSTMSADVLGEGAALATTVQQDGATPLLPEVVGETTPGGGLRAVDDDLGRFLKSLEGGGEARVGPPGEHQDEPPVAWRVKEAALEAKLADLQGQVMGWMEREKETRKKLVKEKERCKQAGEKLEDLKHRLIPELWRDVDTVVKGMLEAAQRQVAKHASLQSESSTLGLPEVEAVIARECSDVMRNESLRGMLIQMKKRLAVVPKLTNFWEVSLDLAASTPPPQQDPEMVGPAKSSMSTVGTMTMEDARLVDERKKSFWMESQIEHLRKMMAEEKAEALAAREREETMKAELKQSRTELADVREELMSANQQITESRAAAKDSRGTTPSPPSPGTQQSSSPAAIINAPPPLPDADHHNRVSKIFNAYIEAMTDRWKDRPVVMSSVRRKRVLQSAMEKLGDLGEEPGESLFQPIVVESFEGEDLRDESGEVKNEIHSLVFEQLHKAKVELTVGSGRQRKVVLFKFFGMAEKGSVFLPEKIDVPTLEGLKTSQPHVSRFYKRVGRLFAKAMVDGAPIPHQWASDFLLGFFLEEEPQQEDRMPISRLLSILHDVDAGFDWVKSRALEEPPFQGLTWGDMLNTEDSNPIGYDHWQQVVRVFFMKKVMEGREWQLSQMREGFRQGCSMLCDMLSMLPGGSARLKLVCGKPMTTAQLLQVIDFDEEYTREEVTPAEYRHQPQIIRSVVARLTDDEAHRFFRMVTGFNAMPRSDMRITFAWTDTPGFPTFGTCGRQCFMPNYGNGKAGEAIMLERLREAISRENLDYSEGRSPT